MLTDRLILVAEEEAPAAVPRQTLEGLGCRVDVAADGKGARGRILETMPDLALLEWILARLSGLDVPRQIRGVFAYRLPIIARGARSGDSDIVEVRNAGADVYITKPYNMDRPHDGPCRASSASPSYLLKGGTARRPWGIGYLRPIALNRQSHRPVAQTDQRPSEESLVRTTRSAGYALSVAPESGFR